MNLSNNRPGQSLSPAASALERLPHLVQKICALWGQPEFEPFVSRLIMDSRDGKRQGLPWEAALDLMFLAELSIAKRALVASDMTGVPFQQMYEKCMSQSQIAGPDPWSDPVANKEASRMVRGQSRSKPAAVNDGRPSPRKKSWWRRLFG